MPKVPEAAKSQKPAWKPSEGSVHGGMRKIHEATNQEVGDAADKITRAPKAEKKS
jgi:hypothetical protein